MNFVLRQKIHNNQSFLISQKTSQEEWYKVAHTFTKQLFMDMAGLCKVYNSNKFHLGDYPFAYRERQLESILLPALSSLCGGLVFAEYPVERNLRKFGYKIKESKGHYDFWCIYKNYTFVIEVKQSSDFIDTDTTFKDSLIDRWKCLSLYQLHSMEKDLKSYLDPTKGIVRIGLHFVNGKVNTDMEDVNVKDLRFDSKGTIMRIANDLDAVKPGYTTPDFAACWEIEKSMVKSFSLNPSLGLFLFAKFLEPIEHEGMIE